MADWILLSGNANPPLATKIGQLLGKPLAKSKIQRFADGEIFVEIGENVRGREAYIIQSTCPPVNDNLMELLILIDALKRASAEEITVIMPYYGYARQDRKVAPRTPISAKLVADLIDAAGATRVVSMDLHAGQIQGFFDIPFDNVFALPVVLDHLKKRLENEKEVTIVSPDAGGVERARAFAKRLDCGVAMIDKRRTAPNEARAMNVVGDVDGKTVVLLDDLIDTAGTLAEASQAVISRGARAVLAAGTHGLFSGPAIERIEKSQILEVIVTDTVPLSARAAACKKVVQLSVADLLAETIRRIRGRDSLSSLFL